MEMEIDLIMSHLNDVNTDHLEFQFENATMVAFCQTAVTAALT